MTGGFQSAAVRTAAWALAALSALLALRLGLMLAGGSGLHVDEAQYWVWSRALDWGYYSKPPVIASLIAAGTALGGDGIVWIRLPAMLCWLAATALTGWLAARMAGSAAGWWSAALLAATPAAGLLGLVATTDGPLLLGWTAAMAFSWLAQTADNRARAWRHWTLAGLALGFALMSKYTAAAMPLSWALLAVLAVLARAAGRGVVPSGLTSGVFAGQSASAGAILRGAAWAGLIGLLCLVPNLAWNASHGWPTLQHTLEITVQSRSRAGDTAADLLLHVAGQLLQVGPGVLAVAALAGWRRLRHRGAPDAAAAPVTTPAGPMIWALCWALPLHGLALLQAFRSGTQINWTAPALVGICLACGIWVAAAPPRARRVVAIAALAGAALFAAIAAHVPGRVVTAIRGEPPRVQLDAWHKTRGWAEILAPWQATVVASGLPVVTGERDVFVQAAYVWRDHLPPLRAWRPGGPIRHQFDLVAPLENPPPSAFWWLGRGEPPADLAPTHRRMRHGQAQHGRLRLQLWLLDNRAPATLDSAMPSPAGQVSRP